jgi:hypothetical protein
MKKITCLFLFASILVITGCPKDKGRVPEVIAQRVMNYKVNEFELNLNSYHASSDLIKKQDIRDEIIFKLKRNIDGLYSEFEEDIFQHRASTNILADFTELAIAGATGITNGERAKTILAIALTAFKGGRKSVDVNFFRERTTEILIVKMRGSRARVETEIINGLNNDVRVYPLDQALGDLIRYFYAGTLHNALEELSQQTGSESAAAQNIVRVARGARDVVRSRFNASVQINQIIQKLNEEANSNDDTTRNAAKKKLLAALNKLKAPLKISTPFGEGNSATELLDVLIVSLRNANQEQGAITTGVVSVEIVLEAFRE